MQSEKIETVIRETLRYHGGVTSRATVMRNLGSLGCVGVISDTLANMPDVVVEHRQPRTLGHAPRVMLRLVESDSCH